jgi:hypothetical protein
MNTSIATPPTQSVWQRPPYTGQELSKTEVRPGSMDFAKIPSRGIEARPRKSADQP